MEKASSRMLKFALQPEGPPQIVGPAYIEKEGNTDETVNLSCSAKGFPSPTVVWTTSDGQVPFKRTLLAPNNLLSAEVASVPVGFYSGLCFFFFCF